MNSTLDQLRQVFVELHAMTTRGQAAFAHAREQFDAGGQPLERERAERAMSVMLMRPAWWPEALRTACVTAPYEGVAA